MAILAPALEVIGLGGSLVAAVLRMRWAPEALVAAAVALAVVAAGAISPQAAGQEIRDLLPVVGFLVAVLVLGRLLAAAGLFAALGRVVADRAAGSPSRLFGLVFAVAAGTTVVLSLDTTVVLLAPVVLATVRRVRLGAAPYLLACVHLANSGSLLLPVSNLSNLLAASRTHLGFLRFAVLMAAPAVVAVAVDYLGLRLLWRRRLGTAEPGPQQALEPGAGHGPEPAAEQGSARLPAFACAVLAATVLGFLLCGALGVAPVWPAAAGAAVMAVPALRGGTVRAGPLIRSSGWDFAVFVLGIGVVVAALAAGPVGTAIRTVLPRGDGLPALLGVAVAAAVLANLVNNLPATLLVLGVLSGAGTGPLPVLAALIGLNVGPNLTYAGSLATLLWRRLVPAEDRPGFREFTVAGLVTVPATLLLATCALWAAGQVVG